MKISTRNIVIIFSALAFTFYLFSDKIVNYIAGLNPFISLFATTLLNPGYIVLIFTFLSLYGWRGAIGGFLIALFSDLISLPHFLTDGGTISTVSPTLMPEISLWNMY